MLAIQQQLAEQKQKERLDQAVQKQAEAARKQRELEEQKIRDEQRRARNTLLQALEKERKAKAMEILNVLTIKGHKKIGKEKIKELERNPDRVDYDTVIEYYQAVLKKEREQIEEDKKKKLREVELWTRAVREEEKIAIEKYAADHGDTEMEQIQASIKEKQAKELKDKQALESAKTVFEAHMVKAMAKRHAEWEQRKRDFANTQMEALKEEILTHAREELRKVVNREKVAKQAAERAARDAEIARKKREDGTADEVDLAIAVGAGAPAGGGDGGGWARNQTKAMVAPPDQERAARNNREPRDSMGMGGGDNAFKRSDRPRANREEENKKPEGFARGPRKEPADVGFARGNFAKKDASEAEAGKQEGRRPTQGQTEPAGGTGFGFRSTNAGASRGAARGGSRGGGRRLI